MASWHQTIIVGNVGQEPDLRYTPSNIPVCSYSVAVTERWNDAQTKEKREKTTWYRVTCWRGLAETAAKYVRKGEPIMVVGTVEARGYKNNAGEIAASLELTASSFQLLGRKPDGESHQENTGNDFTPPTNMGDIPF